MPARRFVEWGLQQRYYQGLPLQIDSASLVTTNFAGVSSTAGGSYNTNVIGATLLPAAVVICSTGPQSHIGLFRVHARVLALNTLDTRVRLSWQEGSGRFQANDYATPTATGTWVDVDLGVISIPPALSGA